MISIPYALDALNFFAADARNALGPFVNVYLVTDRHWSQTEVGLVATMSGLLGIALQTPIGAAIDLTPAKRGVIVLSISVMAFASLIYQALTPLVIADIMHGAGRYNLAQGAVAATQGIGASISPLAAGVIVDHFGYSVSFLALGAAAAIAFFVFMPETRDEESIAHDRETLALEGAASS
jgi:sugar phosphate permease